MLLIDDEDQLVIVVAVLDLDVDVRVRHALRDLAQLAGCALVEPQQHDLGDVYRAEPCLFQRSPGTSTAGDEEVCASDIADGEDAAPLQADAGGSEDPTEESQPARAERQVESDVLHVSLPSR